MPAYRQIARLRQLNQRRPGFGWRVITRPSRTVMIRAPGPSHPSSQRRSILCASTLGLRPEPADEVGSIQYRSTGRKEKDRASFSLRFDKTTEVTGGMCLKLWVSTSEGDDLDLFVVIQKFDSRGREVFFSGYNGFERDAAAKGWLRVSHLELDQTLSTPPRPWHSHTRIQKLRPGEIVPVEVEIWPSSTLFEAGSTLQLAILGHDAAKYPAFRHQNLVNRGLHTILTGGQYDSHLVIPVNQSSPLIRADFDARRAE
jgi:predicted acyl esterase